jgi:hypothetical protein
MELNETEEEIYDKISKATSQTKEEPTALNSNIMSQSLEPDKIIDENFLPSLSVLLGDEETHQTAEVIA